MIHVNSKLKMKYYKYVAPAGLDILINNRIKVCDFSLTNDPFEVLPRIDYPIDKAFWNQEFENSVENDPVFNPAKRAKQFNPIEYERQRTEWVNGSISHREEGIREIPHELRSRFTKVVGFVCLTTKPDDIVMWGHYADCHKGIVVEFDGDNVLFANYPDSNGNNMGLLTVDYTDTRPVLRFGDPFRTELLACKSKVWTYENEVRLLLNRDACKEDGGHMFYYLPPACITGVILGTKASEPLRAQTHFLNNTKWKGSLKISYSVEHPEEYRMVIQEQSHGEV